jgi:thiamine-monophosphate kinase
MIVGPGDDAAVAEPERNRLEVFTVDAQVEGIHFDRRFTPPSAIGHRALAVNLSDLAAMGATPRLALLSFALPARLEVAEFDEMVDGLTALASTHGVTVAGGNLTRIDGPMVIDVTLVGSVKPRRVLTRSGARAGDELYLTGTIGAAAAGLEMLQQGRRDSEECIRRYLYPEARVRAGLIAGRNRAATACMDLSDGLADAVRQLAQASGVGAAVDAASLPIDREGGGWFERRGESPVHTAIARGDDYELLLAVRPRTRGRMEALRRHAGVPLTRIGVCTADPAIVLREKSAEAAMPQGYAHFR